MIEPRNFKNISIAIIAPGNSGRRIVAGTFSYSCVDRKGAKTDRDPSHKR